MLGAAAHRSKVRQTDREERSKGSEGKTSSFQQLRLKTISVFTQRERLKLLQCGRDDVTKVRRSKPETLSTDQMFDFLVVSWFDTFTRTFSAPWLRLLVDIYVCFFALIHMCQYLK